MKSRSKISLNALRTFEAVVRHRSMTRAANELLVTPGAVSRQVSELQAVLSFDLFEGPRTSYIVTQSGHQLATTVTSALDEIDAVLLALDDERDKILDVTCLSTFAIRWLIPRMHSFRAAHPEIDLRLSTDPRRPDKTAHRIDVSILALAPNTPLGAKDTILFKEKLGPILMPPLEGHAEITSFEQIQKRTRLTSKTRPNAWSLWLSNHEHLPIPTANESEFEHLSLAIEAAAFGLGVCVTPEHLVADDVGRKRLSAPFGFLESGYTYIVRAHGRQKRKVNIFISWLKNEIGVV